MEIEDLQTLAVGTLRKTDSELPLKTNGWISTRMTPYLKPEIHFLKPSFCDMGVSKNRGTPKSSILIGISIINHPFWGTPIFGNIHIFGIYIRFPGGSSHYKSVTWHAQLKRASVEDAVSPPGCRSFSRSRFPRCQTMYPP